MSYPRGIRRTKRGRHNKSDVLAQGRSVPNDGSICVSNRTKGHLKLRGPEGGFVYAKPNEDIIVLKDWRTKILIERKMLEEVPVTQRVIHEVEDY